MKVGGGKQKGNAFERLICKRLSLAITQGRRDDVLWRSAISGGRATVHSKKGKAMPHVAGDICAVHQEAFDFVTMFYCELKHYRDLQFGMALAERKGRLVEFWKDTVSKANKHDKLPILIFKQNRLSILCGMDSYTILYFTESTEHIGHKFSAIRYERGRPYLRLPEVSIMYVVPFEVLLGWVEEWARHV